jgi:transposase
VTPPDLTRLSHEEKDALILALLAQLGAAHEKIAALEARLDELTRPPKTPDNSSKPPSQGQKPNQPDDKTRPPRKRRPGVGRALHPNPDREIERKLSTCPTCASVFPEASQTPQQVYDRIELPPVRPDVTRVRLFGGRCACCGERATAEAPPGLEPGSPFGTSVAAMVVYLHYAHAVGMERLALLMEELFGLSISEGAISNILARAREPLLDATAAIEKVVLASPVVCSDETSVRVKGKTWWEWVFIGTLAVLHVIKPSRGKAVVSALFGDIRPEVWVSDMLGSQRGHAVAWQVCLAHLIRDAKYAIENGDTVFSAPFRLLLLRAMAIGKRRDGLKDTTLKQYLHDLDRRLDRIMGAIPIGEPGRKLHKRMLANRAHLFVFMTNRAVPYTNNISERHLRPSVIFRKVTNGFRCEWGAETYAAFRSVVSTAKANGASVLETVRFVLSDRKPGSVLDGVG